MIIVICKRDKLTKTKKQVLKRTPQHKENQKQKTRTLRNTRTIIQNVKDLHHWQRYIGASISFLQEKTHP